MWLIGALHERNDPVLRRDTFAAQEAKQPSEAAAPGFRLHPLMGDRAGDALNLSDKA